MANDPYLQPGDDDFVIVCRPTEPTSLTYRVLFDPSSEMWTLTQSVRVFVPSQGRWQIEELVELRFWRAEDLLRTLRTFAEGALGYFEVAGVAELQADVDRVTDR